MPKRPLGSSQGGKSLSTAKRARYVRSTKPRFNRRNKGISAKALISKFAQHPFPAEWRTKITWDPSTALLAPGANQAAYVVRLNDLYDPDYSNFVGNGQPLFTDQMISATGPYQRFRVDGWKCKITLANASPAGTSANTMPLDVYICQGANNAVDVDTFGELVSSPGTITDLLGGTGSCKDVKTWYINGRTNAYVPPGTAKDDSYCGDYTTSPSKQLFLGIGFKNADITDSAALKVHIKMQIEFDVVFFARDGVAS